jgi:hypothetical protein
MSQKNRYERKIKSDKKPNNKRIKDNKTLSQKSEKGAGKKT